MLYPTKFFVNEYETKTVMLINFYSIWKIYNQVTWQ